MGNLATPGTVQALQKALHAKAKAEPSYRFYSLYDKVFREDVLAHAYACCKANKGAAGVDGERFSAIMAYGWRRAMASGTGAAAQEQKLSSGGGKASLYS